MPDNSKAIADAKNSRSTLLELSSISVKDVTAIAQIETLKRVNLFEFGGDFSLLRGISQLHSVSMIDGCEPEDFELLADVPSLRCLALTHWGAEDLSGIGKITQLQELSLSGNEQYTNIEFLKKLVSLEVLDLEDGQFSDLGPVSKLTRLRSLNLANCDEVTDIGPLAGLILLTNLDLRSVSATDLRPLCGLVNLRTLRIQGDITSIDPIRNLRHLEAFELGYCKTISDFTFLSTFDRLKELTIESALMTDASPLAHLTNLESLSLQSTQVEDISPLANLVGIRSLNLRRTKVRDLGPLKKLDLSGKFYLDFDVEYRNNPQTS